MISRGESPDGRDRRTARLWYLPAVVVLYFAIGPLFDGGSERDREKIDAATAGGQTGTKPANATIAERLRAAWDVLTSPSDAPAITRPPREAPKRVEPTPVKTTTERPRNDLPALGAPKDGESVDPATKEGRARAEAARRRTIALLPPSAWVQLRPDMLRDVDPARLKAENGALVIARAYLETPDGFFLGPPSSLGLREVSTGFVRVVYVRHGGPEAGQGWGVAAVPPGRYVPVGAPTMSRIQILRDGTMVQEVSLPRGSVEVPVEEAVTIRSGDVLYLGSEVGTIDKMSRRPNGFTVQDQSEAAQAWIGKELPQFAPHLKTRLLPSIGHLQ